MIAIFLFTPAVLCPLFHYVEFRDIAASARPCRMCCVKRSAGPVFADKQLLLLPHRPMPLSFPAVKAVQEFSLHDPYPCAQQAGITLPPAAIENCYTISCKCLNSQAGRCLY